jgi:diaminohydroxyphosphoribosylaminopyrimidine deaminase/5-amino-6-(5-phosphoribosylamino)uracil reductase
MLAGSGIRHVVVGMKDPNSLVSGRGIKKLRSAGVEVAVGVLEREAREVNRVFLTHIRAKRPYVHVKIAQSIDGFIASPNARRRWISSAASRALVHRWRSEYDAILVGAGTVLEDNPRLNVRLVEGRDPAIVIMDGKFATPLHARVFKGDRKVIVIVDRNRTRLSVRKLEGAKARGITVIAVGGEKGKIPLTKVLKSLYRLGLGSLLVEGGADVFGQFIGSRFVDELSVFVSPVVLGKGLPAFGGRYRDLATVLPGTQYRKTTELVGDDIHFHAVRS